MVVYPDTLEDCLCITNYTADFLHVWFRRRKFLLTENKSKVEFSTTDLSLLVRTLGAGAQATDPVSTVSECVYTQRAGSSSYPPICGGRPSKRIRELYKIAQGKFHL